jgi:deazaflavin-dependent oxidoreductase (nitroreductase family)
MPVPVVPPEVAFKVVTTFHRTVFDLSKGLVGGRIAGMEVVKLTTIGRRSGKRRDTMLTAPIVDDSRVVLVASKGGAPRHPAWYVNLRANPAVEVTRRGRRRAMVARTATAAEKAELWPRIVDAYGGYGAYQRRTDRDIPVVILEPRGR